MDEQLVIPSYLAAIRPSSIRHRHTSRGCLWRTSGSTCMTYRQRGCRGTNNKKVTYLKGKIFPEINFCFYQKKRDLQPEHRGYVSGGILSLLCVSLFEPGIPQGPGCAAEGMKA